MKFKKSHSLLIVMAIFLLISIGSVCAASDSDLQAVSDESDVVSIDDTSDVVLAEGDDTGNDGDDTQKLINTTVVSDDKKVKDSETPEIDVTVNDNESNPIKINTSDITVTEGNKTINIKNYTDSKIILGEKLAIGNHTLLISYLGNGTYAPSNKTIILSVYGNETFSVPATVSSDSQTVEIPVTLNNGLEDVSVDKDNLKVYYNDTGEIKTIDFTVENNVIKFSLTGIITLPASVTVNYTTSENKNISKTVKIITSTKIDASDLDTSESANYTITVEVKDAQDNVIAVTEGNLTFNGPSGASYSYNSTTKILTITGVTKGIYNLTITYKGNDAYNSSSKEIKLSIHGNETFTVKNETVGNYKNPIEIPFSLTDGVDEKTLDTTKLTLNLTYIDSDGKVKNEIINVISADDGIIKFDGIETPTKVVVKYTTSENKNYTYTVNIKTNTIIEVSDVNATESDSYNITVIFKDIYGNTLNITGNNFNLSNVKNWTYNSTSHILKINGLKKGIYNITVNYKGNDTYLNSNQSFMLNIRGDIYINTNETAININSTKNGQVTINNITNGVDTFDFDKNNVSVMFSYSGGNITLDYELENGVIKFNLTNVEFTNGTLIITYNGTVTQNITVKRIYNTKIEAINTEAEYQSGNFTFRLIDIDTNKTLANKTIILSVSLSTSAGSGVTITNTKTVSGTTDENGIAVIKNSEIYFYDAYFTGQIMTLNIGKTSVEISSNDTVATKLKTNVTIKKAAINVNIENFNEYYGTDKKVTISVTNKNTGDVIKYFIVKLQIPGTSSEYYYVQTNASGIAQIAVSGLYPNDYTFTASPNSTDNVNNTSAKKTVTIKKIPSKIDITSSLTISYNTGATVTFKVTNSLTGKAQSGVYVLVKLYTTATKYDQYLFQTNDKGTVSFSASLAVGKHKIEISSADTRYDASTLSKTITVKKANGKFTAPKVTAYYKQDKSFNIKLTNTKNKKAIYNAKVNIKVYVAKNKYYNYNGYTGADGKLKLKIDLKPGTYKVVVSGADSKNYAAKKVTSKITVKKAPAKVTIQKSAKKSAKSFKVTVKNKKTKKVITGVKVKVKVYTGKKAKTFTVKTNSKGIAQVSTKSIKVGSHKVVVTSANKYVTLKQTKGTVKIKK